MHISIAVCVFYHNRSVCIINFRCSCMFAHMHPTIITAVLSQTPLGAYLTAHSHSFITVPGVYPTTLKAESGVTTNLLLFTTYLPSPSSSYLSSYLSSIPSSSPPSSCQSQSVLGYSTALGVVSVLLIISLVGHVVYTVVVCVLVRKTRHSPADVRR